MNRHWFNVSGLFLLCFMTGYSVIYFTSSDNSIARDPAAIGKIYDFSHLNGEELNTAIKRRLISGLQVQKTQGDQEISLGHFAFIDQTGHKKFACEEFDKVAMVFQAEGVSVSGEPPQMEIEGDCRSSQDVGKIDPVWVPVSKILAEKSVDGELEFKDNRLVTLRFNHLPEEWPKTWVLKSVRLFKKDTLQALTIQKEELAQIQDQPSVLRF